MSETVDECMSMSNPEIIDSVSVPSEIIKAAMLIENWAKENGHHHYEIMGLCSRDHAEMIRHINSFLEVDRNNVQYSPSGSGLKFVGFPK
jgi:hypothetical protein